MTAPRMTDERLRDVTARVWSDDSREAGPATKALLGELARARAREEELSAHVDVLRHALDILSTAHGHGNGWPHPDGAFDCTKEAPCMECFLYASTRRALASTPAQSLHAVRAEAWEAIRAKAREGA